MAAIPPLEIHAHGLAMHQRTNAPIHGIPTKESCAVEDKTSSSTYHYSTSTKVTVPISHNSGHMLCLLRSTTMLT